MTQTKAAEAVGMSQGTLGELEREGKRGSSYTSALAKLYDVSPYWLSTGKGDMRGSPSDAKNFRNRMAEALTEDQLAWLDAMDFIDPDDRAKIIEQAEFRRWKSSQGAPPAPRQSQTEPPQEKRRRTGKH